jgi:tetratricopeptide (TPR) repeat protein
VEEHRGREGAARVAYESLLEVWPDDTDARQRLVALAVGRPTSTPPPAPATLVAPTASPTTAPIPPPTMAADKELSGGGFRLTLTPGTTAVLDTLVIDGRRAAGDSLDADRRIEQLFDRATAQQAAGARAEAIAAYEELLRVAPEHALGALHLSEILMVEPSDTDLDRAATLLGSLRLRWPERTDLLYRLGAVHARRGDHEQARRLLKQFIQIASGPPELLQQATRLLAELAGEGGE